MRMNLLKMECDGWRWKPASTSSGKLSDHPGGSSPKIYRKMSQDALTILIIVEVGGHDIAEAVIIYSHKIGHDQINCHRCTIMSKCTCFFAIQVTESPTNKGIYRVKTSY